MLADLVAGLIAGLLLLLPHLAQAQVQVAGTAALSSNLMFRGESVSQDDPALTLGVNLDSPSGFYAGATVSLAAGSGDPRVVTAEQYAGYAVRRGETSVEVGVIHRSYNQLVDEDYRRGFFEGYVGISHRAVRARIYVSPDYLRAGRASYYGEVNARLLAVGRWSLDAHAGLSLIPVEFDSGGRKIDDYEDVRVQMSRPVGRVMVSAGVAASNYPVYSASGRPRGFVSALLAF